MPDPNDWLSQIQEATTRITSHANNLRSLSSAFGRVGNFAVADELLLMAFSLEGTCKKIHKAVRRELDEGLTTAKQHTASVLFGGPGRMRDRWPGAGRGAGGC